MAECLLCAMEDADEASVVFRDPLWAAEIVPGYDVPGWFILRARRHAERITGLADAELSTYGRRARDLVAAVADVTGAPATYQLVFGENYPHFHVLIAARGADVPPHMRAGNILGLRADHSDLATAAKLVPGVRAAYCRHAGIADPAAPRLGATMVNTTAAAAPRWSRSLNPEFLHAHR
jgi:diadenosine tetraphosphate (Ap4A) HIT family hydrolase